MKLLMVGDVVGESGCEHLLKTLPRLKREYGVDITVVNGENSAKGNGITPFSAEMIISAGADVVTGGNHTFRRKEFFEMLDGRDYFLRPANMTECPVGHGVCVLDLGKTQVAVVNLLGVFGFKIPPENPFLTADEILKDLENKGVHNIFVDLHAEATGEKRALGFYLDGRVTAVCGTHTHIGTVDTEILPNSTAYVSDIGMTGPVNSCLGVIPQRVIDKLKDGSAAVFEQSDNKSTLDAVLITFDEKTGRAQKIDRIKA